MSEILGRPTAVPLQHTVLRTVFTTASIEITIFHRKKIVNKLSYSRQIWKLVQFTIFILVVGRKNEGGVIWMPALAFLWLVLYRHHKFLTNQLVTRLLFFVRRGSMNKVEEIIFLKPVFLLFKITCTGLSQLWVIIFVFRKGNI